MILEIEQIHVPESGKYKEVIYDIKSSWNSQKWTWLKFTDNDYDEWCGEFRGEYRGHGISNRDKCIYILTSDYLYLLDATDGKLVQYKDRPEYQELTVSSLGDCIVASYNHLEVIDNNLSSIHVIEALVPLDMIIFLEWIDNTLLIHADEFCNWDNHIKLSLDANTFELSIITETSRGVNR